MMIILQISIADNVIGAIQNSKLIKLKLIKLINKILIVLFYN